MSVSWDLHSSVSKYLLSFIPCTKLLNAVVDIDSVRTLECFCYSGGKDLQ